MGGNSKTIIWFRRDLRIEDNPALAAAAREGQVCPVYIWSPDEEGQFYPGRVSRWWLKQSLIHLGESLKCLGAGLLLIKAQSTLSALLDCIHAVGATKVVYNHLYEHLILAFHFSQLSRNLLLTLLDIQNMSNAASSKSISGVFDRPFASDFFQNLASGEASGIGYQQKILDLEKLIDPVSLARDHNIKQKLSELGISVESFNGDLLNEPWEVYDDEGHAFTTFESYWNKCSSMDIQPASFLPPWQLAPASGNVRSCLIEELGLETESEKSSNALLGRGWSPGWSNADKALTEFIENHLLNYSNNRVKVEENSTSLLSPCFHFGELSVRKVFRLVRSKQILWAKEGNSVGLESIKFFVRAIGLREYARYLCFNFPFTHERSLLRNLRYFPWNADMGQFKAWRQGRTGYPLVDAGMRELWATGWIHNRIRVIVAGFSVKFLLLPWKWGMKYFWDTLLDADLECDILGWQYISGSLPDGHELERLDSPEVQGSRYDPEGEYVRCWLPELARMPTEWIHHPWDAPTAVLKASGIELGINYPKPIVDIDLARENLRKAIFLMWETEAAAKATDPSGTTNEIIVDNSEAIGNLGIPNMVSREKAPCPTTSSHDQRVPSIQISKNVSLIRKRPKYMEEESKDETSKMDIEECSTAESSSAKKPTTSRYSFSVPHSGSRDEDISD